LKKQKSDADAQAKTAAKKVELRKVIYPSCFILFRYNISFMMIWGFLIFWLDRKSMLPIS
jgi:hypothetical protein